MLLFFVSFLVGLFSFVKLLGFGLIFKIATSSSVLRLRFFLAIDYFSQDEEGIQKGILKSLDSHVHVTKSRRIRR